jgi:hypothetical protein
MKKSIGLLSVMLALSVMSCTDRTTEVKKEVIVTPAEKPAVIVKEEPAKPTSISVDKNGVKVQSKKVDVKLGN